MGAILELAKRDARRFTNDSGFEEQLTIIEPGEDAVIIQGLTSRHSTGFDSEGKPIVSDNCHCSFSELDLNEAGRTTRDANGDLIIKDWTVQFDDAIQSVSYKIAEAYPDNTLGLIRCTLSLYE